MSDRLAISTAFSVLMMAGYVLFGANSVSTPIGTSSLATPVSVSASALPSIGSARDLLGLPAVR